MPDASDRAQKAQKGGGAPNSLEAYWLPFTANRAFKAKPRLVSRAEGAWLYNQYGEPVLDGSSGLFCSPAGQSHPKIAEAVAAQLATCAYVNPFGTAHGAAFELAEKVAQLNPDPLNRVFFVNSGSEAVDTALKIVMAYHLARGEAERSVFVSRDRAYHGVNIGGLSLSGIARNRRQFPGTMPTVAFMRDTHTGEELGRPGLPSAGADRAEDLERICQTFGPEKIAAVFVEPVAGSTGVLPPPDGYLRRLREICDRYGVLLVFDEVITGFGRLGAPFAAQRFDVVPDLITMAKAITNGAIPMGAVAVRDAVHDSIVEPAADGAIEFFHGYTFSAHPAATAAGLAMMEIIAEEGLFERVRDGEAYFQEAIHSLCGHPRLRDVRSIGYMAGLELHPEEAPGALGGRLQEALFWAGLHVKFTADTGIVAPPFIMERPQIDRMVEILRAQLDAL